MVKKIKEVSLSQSEMLLSSRDLACKLLGRWLTNHKLMAIKHLPDTERLIEQVFKRCVIMIFLMKKTLLGRNKIFSMLEFPLVNKWTTFLDKLSTSDDQNILSILLFKILVRELILRGRDCQPFWTPVYKGLSEKLLLLTETDFVDSHLNLSKVSLKKQEENSQYLTILETKVQKMNSQKICYPLFTSLTVDKWEDEVISPEKEKNLKVIKIQIYPTVVQRQKLREIIDVHRYIYNKTLHYIKNFRFKPNFIPLRNLLVTERTKSGYIEKEVCLIQIDNLKNEKKEMIEQEKEFIKDQKEKFKVFKKSNKKEKNLIKQEKEKIEKIIKQEIENCKEKKENIDNLIKQKYKECRKDLKNSPFIKNPNIQDFELKVSKEIRSNSVKSVCDAHKSGFSNLKNGNIKFFNMKFKKKSEVRKCVELSPTDIKFSNNKLQLCPNRFKEHKFLEISKKNQKKYGNVNIKHKCDLVVQKGKWYILIPIDYDLNIYEIKKEKFCGIDGGLRDFAVSYSQDSVITYTHNRDLMKKYNDKLDILNSLRQKPKLQNKRNKYRKKQLNKIESKKINLVNNIHWKTINHIVKNNDIIFYGDIKSHDIVGKSKNKTLNRMFNDMKFFIFKKRLEYKCKVNCKKVFFVNESYTTQGCSKCGNLWKSIGSSKIYKCKKCDFICDRDVNSAKNICMKGLQTCNT